MNVYLVLCWNCNENQDENPVTKTEFSVLAAFSKMETAERYCDELQQNDFISNKLGLFYWVEAHELDKELIGDVNA